MFEPIRIVGTEIPNRVVRAAHSTRAAWVDTNDDLMAYHEARARGGVGLSILEIAGVHPTSATAIPVYSDRVVAGYQKLMDRIRPHGMRVQTSGSCLGMLICTGLSWHHDVHK